MRERENGSSFPSNRKKKDLEAHQDTGDIFTTRNFFKVVFHLASNWSEASKKIRKMSRDYFTHTY